MLRETLTAGVGLARNMLVTGTSYGLGAAVSEAVRSRGDTVLSMSRDRPPAPTEIWTKVDFADVDRVGAAVGTVADSLDRQGTRQTF